MKFFNGVIVVLLLLTSGCSRTTMREIGEKHQAEIEAVLAELHTLAESIPKEDFDPESKQLDVELYMHVADRMSNTVMGSKDNFSGNTKQINDPTYFDMYAFAYKGMLEDRFLSQRAEPTFEAEIKAFIDLRYAIVYHPVDYRDAIITDKEFLIAPLKMVVAMYDRKAKKWLFVKTYNLEPPKEINFTFREGQRESNAEFQVKNYFIETVKPQIAQYIESQFGGTIEFDHDAYRRDGTRRLPY
ncbi:MAG: hypothetical protein ABL921_32625 [Pirellula sp.]